VVIKPLRLMVLTPAETLLDVAEVAWVQAQLSDGGGIGIYPGHAPLLAETATASLRYADESGEHALDLEAGILQVERDGVTIFTSGLAQASEVSETALLSSPKSSEASDGPRFDRLARALLTTLQAQPEEALVLSPALSKVEREVEGSVLGEVEGWDADDEKE
jgi:F0F1-type ATP synthase epsilon subunit